MKMQSSIIDFTGMQFRREESIDKRIRAKSQGRASSRRRRNHLTRNVRGTIDQILGW